MSEYLFTPVIAFVQVWLLSGVTEFTNIRFWHSAYIAVCFATETTFPLRSKS
jgi:hypothetical protein